MITIGTNKAVQNEKKSDSCLTSQLIKENKNLYICILKYEKLGRK